MVEVIEHDFTEKSLDINLSYNSFYMITIFKMNLKSKGVAQLNLNLSVILTID